MHSPAGSMYWTYWKSFFWGFPAIWGNSGWFTLPETNSSPLKTNGWKMNFLLGPGLFSGVFAVSFREGSIGPKGDQGRLSTEKPSQFPSWIDESCTCCRNPAGWSMVTRWWFHIFFIFTTIWGRLSNLTDIFQMGWNHQPGELLMICPMNWVDAWKWSSVAVITK